MLINLNAELIDGAETDALRIDNDEDTNGIDFTNVSCIELNFPSFTDGRAYSQARTLRKRGFTGDLRATGDVLVDQLFLMKRCGFTSFQLKRPASISVLRETLTPFSASYQTAEDERIPLWRQSKKDVTVRVAS